MTRGRRLLIAVGGVAVFFALVAGAIILSGRSLVIIDNRSNAPLTLEVASTIEGDFAWSGELKAGQRLFRIVRFTADGGVRAICRDEDGVHRTTGGHVQPGWPYRLDVLASGCGSVRIEADRLP